MKTALLFLALVSSAFPLRAVTYEPVNAFRLGPRNPGSGPLVRHTDGNDYGTTPSGGPKGEGTVYRVTPTGVVEMVSAMDFLANPNPSGLTADGAGLLWGVSQGIFDAGTIFKVDPATGTRTTVFTFAPASTNGPNGGGPTAELFYDGAGFMWGTAAFGPNPGSHGTIFKIEVATGAFTKVAGFTGTGGAVRGTRPRGKLVAGGAGFLWGTTSFGGTGDFGTVFKVDMATHTVTTVVDFTGKDGGAAKGETPTAALVADGLFLWGTTHSAAFSSDPGTVFKVAIASPHAFTSVFTFTGASGAHRGVGSAAALVQQSPGVLLGVSPSLFTFPPDFGTIFRIDATNGTQTTVLSFTGSTGLVPGSNPPAALVPVGAGLFRGTTNGGGSADAGTVFEFNANTDTLTTKATLLGTEPPPSGAEPAGKLVADGLGFLWGVTERFGLSGKGTIFKMDIDTGEIVTVVDFTGDGGAAPGSEPAAELILRNGLLWGVTRHGGISPNTAGTIFKVDPANGTFTSVAQMSSSGVGPSQPSGALLPGDAGFLWGCTADGGAHDEGCIYKVDATTGAVEVVVSFAQNPFDPPPSATPLGSRPSGGLVRDSDGNFWGTTEQGGIVADDNGSTVSYGTVFKVDSTTNALTTVVQFTGDAGAAKGKYPNGSLISDGAGAFLGTHGLGVFKVTIATSAYKLLASISGGVNAGLAADGAGKFWGTTREGGSGFFGQGSVFNLTAAGAVQTPVSFIDTAAKEPSGGLLLVGGDLYGVTKKGGVDGTGEVTGGGQIFRVRLVDPPVPATVVAIKGKELASEAGTNYSALGVPEPGPFAGSVKTGTKTVAAIFAGDGTVRARVGGGVSNLANAVITKLGAPSGDVALATLKTDDAVGVTAKNDTVLLKGLTNGPVTIAAREGIDLGTPAGVSIKSFGAIDGAPDAASATFFLATLQNGDVTGKSDSALLTVQANGTVSVLAREGQEVVTGKVISVISALVGVKGALAEGRWRATGTSFGVRLTFADKTQALYTIPATATLPAQWTRWIGLGDTLVGAPLANVEISKLGFPAFGSDGPAVLATLQVGTGAPAVTTKDDTAIVRVDSGGLVLFAREGSLPPGLVGNTIQFKTLSDPVSGANGRTAFAATISGVNAAFSKGIWYAADGDTLAQLARTGLSAPGGGKFASFTNLALPDGATRGPLFTATLATDKNVGIDTKNNFGLWGVNTAGTLKLVLRTGNNVIVDSAPRIVKSFTALLPATGSIGAAHGYDDAGKVAVLATFTDNTIALLELTVP